MRMYADTAARGVLATLLVVSACLVPESADPAGRAAPSPVALDTLLQVGSTRLFVHAEGDGPPLFVVHGGPVLDHGYMVAPLRPLAEGRRLVFHDQRLSGRSAGTVDSASVRLDTLVADIERIREALGHERIQLLAHSWGGLLAMKYALAHPDRTAALLLISPMAPSAALWQEEEALLAAATLPEDTAGMGAVRASAAFSGGSPSAIERLLQLSFRSQLADPTLADSMRFHIEPDYLERSRQFGYLLPDLLGYDLTSQLPRLGVPILIVYGAAEPGGGAGAESMRALLPQARIEVLRGAGHFAFLEQPEAFRALVREFLAGCCG